MKKQETRILLLEDNWIISEGICLQLAEIGYRNVRTAMSLNDAATLLEHETPDLALLDISLGGGKDSLGVAQTLLQRDAAIIFTTGFGLPEDWPKEFGRYHVLLKPLRVSELSDAIASCIA